MRVHPAYVCKCEVPRPLTDDRFGPQEDTGLCGICNGIYDENLYERRLRQHQKDFHWDTMHEFLMDVDPHYASLDHSDRE